MGLILSRASLSEAKRLIRVTRINSATAATPTPEGIAIIAIPSSGGRQQMIGLPLDMMRDSLFYNSMSSIIR